MHASLLDTDTLSEILKARNATVTAKAVAYLQHHSHYTFSAFSRFDIRRGWVDKQATRQLANFEVFCGHSLVLPLTDSIFDRAAVLWATSRQGDHPNGDADLLIAATALEHRLVPVTGKLRHFGWMPGLKVEDWRTA
jgi:tRNA(fMet)-specific endonuclease VapC